MPTKAMLVVSHNIEEAVLMADRVLIFASDPGRVRAELPVPLPRPRDADSPEVRALIDEVYALMTGGAGRARVEPAAPAPEPTACPTPTSAAWRPARAAGRRERQGRADLPQLAEETELTDAELLPLAQALALLGFAQLADGDLHLTPLGRRYVEGAHTLRQELFGQQLLAHVPLAAHIRHSLEQEPSGELPEEPFLQLLSDSLDGAVAERVLRTAIEWGRYGEVFEYDYTPA